MAGRIEIGWEALAAIFTAGISAAAVTWGTITHTQAQVAAMGDTIQIIREDTLYMRDRLDRFVPPGG